MVKDNRYSPENTVITLFILLFYISFISSFRLLGITCLLISIYSMVTCENKCFLRFTKPVLPFVALMLLPVAVTYGVKGTVQDLDFTLMIVGKILVSSILLGTIIARHSALYLVDGILNIGLPQVFNRIFALTFRYFHMIHADLEKGKQALNSRGMKERRGLTSLIVFGEWIGGFFLKSSHHSDLVFYAMKSRGFQGEARDNQLKNKYVLANSLVLTVLLLTTLLIDRMV